MTKEKSFEKYETMMSVFGELDANVAMITEAFAVDIFAVGTSVKVSGEEREVDGAILALDSLERLASRTPLIPNQVRMAIDHAKEGKLVDADDLLGAVATTSRGRTIRPKTIGQKKYVDAVRRSAVVLGVGPAGTGKTYLAVALAVCALKNGDVDRIVLTRPAVEAGEKLGFLPGDLADKVDPYLRPLFDALKDFVGEDAYQRHVERGSIEVAPLAYMRGRTLSNSFIILDEAQNATCEQMKMFLTRLGENSRMVVTGDITQIDLPKNVKSGLVDAIDTLRGVKGVEVVSLTSKDVVRNGLVTRIIEAYERKEARENDRQESDTDAQSK